jgi:hypothetical protein
MAAELKEIHLAHERDAAWLTALWIAIHGGDPPVELVPRELQEGAALGAIEALSTALDAKTMEAVRHALAPALQRTRSKATAPEVELKNLAGLGIHIKEYATEYEHTQAHAVASAQDRVQRPPYCFRFRGATYCVYLPTPEPIHFT